MPAPKLPKVQEIPWFKQYLVIILTGSALILGIAVWFGWNAKDQLLYPRLTPTTALTFAPDYKDQQVNIRGQYFLFSSRQKPLCVAEGGTVKFPMIRADYKPYPGIWGLTDGAIDVAVKVINAEGQEIITLPKFQPGEEISLKGRLRLTTTLDDCNLDVTYQTLYLEVTPQMAGFK